MVCGEVNQLVHSYQNSGTSLNHHLLSLGIFFSTLDPHQPSGTGIILLIKKINSS